MENTFNRKMADEVSKKVQQALSEYFATADFSFNVAGGSYTEDRLKLNLEVRIKSEDGEVVIADGTHHRADLAARSKGLKLEGHLIGSKWSVRGDTYTVTGYETKRPKYPISLLRNDGRKSKAAVGFLQSGQQLILPPLSEFVTWSTVDPDSDAVKEEDVATCDRVQAFVESYYDKDDADKLICLTNFVFNLGPCVPIAVKTYEVLSTKGIKEANIVLKRMYKNLKATKK